MNDTSGEPESFGETPTTRLIKYVIFQTLQIPSLVCCLFVFYCVYRERELRRLQNHAMLLIVLSCFLLLLFELPISLSWLRTGSLKPKTDQTCLYWLFVNYTLFGINTLTMAFASIERYFLIFHSNLIVGTELRRYCLHYFPMIFCCSVAVLWYAVLIFFYPCSQSFDVNYFLCNSACYQYNPTMGTIDWVLSVLVPLVLVIIFNILLLCRALLQKRRMNQPLNWRRSMKLIVQLLVVVVVFLCTQIPLAIFAIIRLAFDPTFLSDILLVWYYFTPYFIILLTPFAYLITTREVLRHFVICKKYLSPGTNAIAPTIAHQTVVRR